MREIVIGAAQMGPIQKAESRQAVVARMVALLEQAAEAGCTLVVFPELTLTTFFPRWYMEDQTEVDAWFEREMPSPATRPLFDRAREKGIAISLGYAELTPDGHHFNTQILTDQAGNIVGKYRKVHLPGHSEFDPERTHQHLEKRYFEPGDLGFPVWRNMDAWMGMLICNDRRWPEAYREMGLQGVELVMLGYNTPSSNSQNPGENEELRRFHSDLSMQAGAYQNSCWVVGVAKAGVEDGHPRLRKRDHLRLQAPPEDRALRPDHQSNGRDHARWEGVVMPTSYVPGLIRDLDMLSLAAGGPGSSPGHRRLA